MNRTQIQVESVSDFEQYLLEKRHAVDSFLDDYLPSEDTPPVMISRAVRYSLFAGGKRLRPILVLASAAAVGGEDEAALPAAAAFELVHTYSLVHDDLPSMDNDSLRRGKPTSHVVFGEAIAILAGDALQAHAFQVLASSHMRPSSTSDSDSDSSSISEREQKARSRLRAIAILAKASGASGMVGGQVADLESEGKAIDAESLEFIHRHKTGALIRAACEVGAILGGGTDSEVDTLAQYGSDVGLAFQIVDDVLDVEGSAESLGKSSGKDEKAGKATYPQIHGMENARKHARDLVSRAVERIEVFGPNATPLKWLAERIVARRA
jgi:geranylgeranyl diphosphate synthase type II